MDGVWRLQSQVQAPGSRIEDAAEWFVENWWKPRTPWRWSDKSAGTFEVSGDLYRVRLGGVEDVWWFIERFERC